MGNSDTDNEEKCDECQYIINCYKEGLYIVSKGEEERIWCQSCFDDMWKDAAADGWTGDDIEEMLKRERRKEKRKEKRKALNNK